LDNEKERDNLEIGTRMNKWREGVRICGHAITPFDQVDNNNHKNNGILL
jgi:hypothetical protein